MRVVATAGHVDHGKSTLVRALTGTDPDRLEEEKKRGLTIDLGFAGLDLPSGEKLAFVDVPGHRRFIGNMLAGLGPAPAVMLVVAADQGWQAQSREHLDAIDALGLRHGLLVITRCGLATPERVAEVRETALGHIAATSLGVVDVVETDAVSGRGIDELRCALDDLVAQMPPVDTVSPVRLWVDRSFSVKGTGTVVTGTLAAGTLRLGDELEVGDERAVVRSLQVLGQRHDEVSPVSRVAVALRGLHTDDVPRGTPLLTPGSASWVNVLDVRSESGHEWQDASAEVSVHIGTASVEARVRPFDERHARLTLSDPLPLRLGDRIIVRDASAGRIHCGATVLDLDPAALTRRGAGRERARVLGGHAVAQLEPLVAERGWVRDEWVTAVGACQPEVLREGLPLPGEGLGRVEGLVVHEKQATAWRAAIIEAVTADAADPLSPGLPSGAIETRLGVPRRLLPALVESCGVTNPDAGLVIRDGRVVGSRHGSSFGADEAALEQLREQLRANPFDAPEADDLVALGLGNRQLAAATQRGAILRLKAEPADIVLLPDAPARAMRELARLPQPFTTSEARQALGTTRRVVIPLLEHLDARGWTRRDGNARVVVR